MPAIAVVAMMMAMPIDVAERSLPSPQDIVAVVNAARLDPVGYGATLELLARRYDGSVWSEEDGTAHNSIEGPAAVMAAATALRTTPAAGQLALDPILAAAARAHAAAQGPTGAVGHASNAGATPGLRVRAAGGDVYVAEVIAYGMHDAADVVRALIVDDGLPSRGHRRTLLSAAYRYAGIACAPHRTQQTMCVIDLAGAPGGKVSLPAQ